MVLNGEQWDDNGMIIWVLVINANPSEEHEWYPLVMTNIAI